MRGILSIIFIVLLQGVYHNALGQQFKVNPHNFSADTWHYTERCSPCHVEDPNNNPDKGFMISYNSDSLTAVDSVYLSGISKLCYACHDGTVAGFSHENGVKNNVSGDDGTSHNHPVSVVYNADSLARYKLYNPEITMSGLGGTIAEDMLVNGRVECTSCHDAHFSMTKTSCKSCPTPKNDTVNSLWVENNHSALCLICHNL